MMMTLPTPYWQSDDGRATLYCGDCLELLPLMASDSVDAVVTDPPYGIGYKSGRTGHNGGTALPDIYGDDDTSLRDAVIKWAGTMPIVVFGSWKKSRPDGCRIVLIWDKGDHVGMGDLSLPWKPNTEEIYIIGDGFNGHRGSSVLQHNAPVSWNSVRFGRVHPHEKPLSLMIDLVSKSPQGIIFDPFAGSGTTGVACIQTGRRFIGIELSEKYCAIAARRLAAACCEDGGLFDPKAKHRASLFSEAV